MDKEIWRDLPRVRRTRPQLPEVFILLVYVRLFGACTAKMHTVTYLYVTRVCPSLFYARKIIHSPSHHHPTTYSLCRAHPSPGTPGRYICSPARLRVPHSTDEALSDAHFWGRKQKASSATAAFFIGPGHSEASTGAIATSARIVGNIKAGDVIPGSVATSTAESTAASVAASKALVTMGIKGSLAVANQFEKRKFSGAQGMMNMAKNIALNAEKFQLLTDKIIRNTDGSIQFPEWDVKKVRRSRATPKTPDNSYSVGSCTRFSSLGCW